MIEMGHDIGERTAKRVFISWKKRDTTADLCVRMGNVDCEWATDNAHPNPLGQP